MVAALSIQEMLIEALSMEGSAKSKWLQIRRHWAGTGNSLLLGVYEIIFIFYILYCFFFYYYIYYFIIFLLQIILFFYAGDPMVLIKAIAAAEYAGSKGKLLSFCEENGLRHKAVVEIKKLRQQLTNEINLNIPDLNLSIDPKYLSYMYYIIIYIFKIFFDTFV